MCPVEADKLDGLGWKNHKCLLIFSRQLFCLSFFFNSRFEITIICTCLVMPKKRLGFTLTLRKTH